LHPRQLYCYKSATVELWAEAASTSTTATATANEGDADERVYSKRTYHNFRLKHAYRELQRWVSDARIELRTRQLNVGPASDSAFSSVSRRLSRRNEVYELERESRMYR